MSSKTKRRKSSAGKNVLIFFIVFIVLEMIFVVGLSLLFKNKDSTPGIAGYSFYVMETDRMGDVVPKGSLVVASDGTPSKDKVNSAILCKDVQGIGTSVFWLDSIEIKEGEDGVTYNVFQKKDPDTKYAIKSSNIVGIANTYYKTAGKIISFVTSTIGMILCIAIPVFLLILIELIIAIVKHSSSDEYDDDYDDEYDDDEYYDDEYDDEYDDRDDRYEDDYDDRPRRRNREDRYDDEPVKSRESKIPKAKEKTDSRNNVKLDDFLFGNEKEGEQIAKRRAQREQQNAADSKAQDDEKMFSKHDVDNSYYEQASKIKENTAEIPAPAPKTRPAPQPQRRPAQARPKTADSSIEDLMKMMDEEQEKLRNKMDN